MTCIIGLAHAGRVYLGGDSAGVDGNGIVMLRKDRKVHRVGEYLIGFTTSFRMGQLLAYSFNPLPPPDAPERVIPFMVNDFIPCARKVLAEGGFVRSEGGAEKGGVFLVGWRDRLFYIDDDFQVGEPAVGFEACGSGREAALGVLWATQGETDPQARIHHALEIVSKVNAYVYPPFYIEMT